MSATSDLKNLVEWWSTEDFENKLHQEDTRPIKVKDVYVQITPKSGSVGQIQAVDPIINNVEVTHVFKCRYYSCINTIISTKTFSIRIQDWFMYKGKKYEVIDFQEDFKNREFMYITTKILYE